MHSVADLWAGAILRVAEAAQWHLHHPGHRRTLAPPVHTAPSSPPSPPGRRAYRRGCGCECCGYRRHVAVLVECRRLGADTNRCPPRLGLAELAAGPRRAQVLPRLLPRQPLDVLAAAVGPAGQAGRQARRRHHHRLLPPGPQRRVHGRGRGHRRRGRRLRRGGLGPLHGRVGASSAPSSASPPSPTPWCSSSSSAAASASSAGSSSA